MPSRALVPIRDAAAPPARLRGRRHATSCAPRWHPRARSRTSDATVRPPAAASVGALDDIDAGGRPPRRPGRRPAAARPGRFRRARDSRSSRPDLGEPPLDAVEGLAPSPPTRGVRIEAGRRAAPDPRRPEVSLRQLVRILVDNAIRHAPRGSAVNVTVTPVGRTARLTGRGRGPGFRPSTSPQRVRTVLAGARAPRPAAPGWASRSRPGSPSGTAGRSKRRTARRGRARGSRSACRWADRISGDLQGRSLATASCTTTSHGVPSHESISFRSRSPSRRSRSLPRVPARRPTRRASPASAAPRPRPASRTSPTASIDPEDADPRLCRVHARARRRHARPAGRRRTARSSMRASGGGPDGTRPDRDSRRPRRPART